MKSKQPRLTYYIARAVSIYSRARHKNGLCGRSINRRPRCIKILIEARAVFVKQLPDSFEAGRSDDESSVIGLVQAINYLRRIISRSVWMLLARERDDDSRVIVAMRRQ